MKTGQGRARRRRILRAWLALTQQGFPFAIGPFPTPVARFHAFSRRTQFSGRVGATAARLVMIMAWPFGALSTTLKIWWRKRKQGQVPPGLRVLLDMYWLALRHNIPPSEYALYRFDKPAARRDLHDYVYANTLYGQLAIVARCGADRRDVQDKDRFAGICAKHGLPHVETLAAFQSGRQTFPAEPFVPDVPMLWTKARHLKGGAGAALWTRDGDTYRDITGRCLSAPQLAADCRQWDCVVQPFITNHPAIARISNGALASLRIVTGMNEHGKAEFVTALLALPYGRQTTSIGGILCSIAPETGCIRHAVTGGGERVTRHPDSGTLIIGAELPFWSESLALAPRAHAAAFARFPFLGWDIALTAEGPVFLETNVAWSKLFHQMLDGPLGQTAFSRLIARHIG